jgi:hypothetical protein
MAATGVLFQLKSGRMSAPRPPQALHVNRGSTSDSRISSGQRSALRMAAMERHESEQKLRRAGPHLLLVGRVTNTREPFCAEEANF